MLSDLFNVVRVRALRMTIVRAFSDTLRFALATTTILYSKAVSRESTEAIGILTLGALTVSVGIPFLGLKSLSTALLA